MFRCENCGTGFNATVASVSENCPRCRANGVEARLSFKLFEREDPKAGGAALRGRRSHPRSASPREPGR